MEFKEEVRFCIPAYFEDNLIFDPQKTVYGIIHNYLPENVKLIAFGMPGTCTWNGGRAIFQEGHTIQKIEGYFVSFIYNFGIDIQLTMTNGLLEETDLYDRYGNALLKLAEKYYKNVEVLVNSPLLESYIREKYPKIRLAKSITSPIEPTIEDCSKYSTILIPFDRNEDYEYIKKLANAGANLEMSIAECCEKNCPFRTVHYENQNSYQIYSGKEIYSGCINKLTTETIKKETLPFYESIGVKNFKLTERADAATTIDNIIEYLIPEKEKFTIRNNLYKCLNDKINWEAQDFYGGKLPNFNKLAEKIIQFQ